MLNQYRFTIIALTTLFFFLTASPSLAFTECSKVYSALVFEEKSDDILFENRPDSIIYPASLTKLMTVYLAFEAIKSKKIEMEQTLTASARAVEASRVNKSNTLNLKVGDKILMNQAIKGSIVKSFNELTVMLAEKISGSEWQFVREMNKKAKDLGMINTNFRNASGLHDYGQFTTDEDLKKLVLTLRKNFPEYYHFFSLKEFKYEGTKYPTHNAVLLKYKGAEGIKTGFTKASGFNLISSALRDNKRIISILTGCESSKKRDDFTKKLLDDAFKKGVVEYK